MISEDDLALMMDEVTRFTHRVIEPALPPVEQVIESAARTRILAAATDAGILGNATEHYGIWGRVHSSLQFSVSSLCTLAERNAGMAWVFHQYGLSHRAAATLELDPGAAPPMLSCFGHFGIGGPALCECLLGEPMTPSSLAFLRDYYDLQTRQRLVSSDPAETLLYIDLESPGETPLAGLVWRTQTEEFLHRTPVQAPHGLNEVTFSRVRLMKPGDRVAPDAGLLAELLYFDGLAIVAIALGTLKRAQRLARAYSRARKQGGKPIAQHSAVREMLASLSVAEQSGQLFLQAQAKHTDALSGLMAVSRWRCHWMPAVCRAINNAMQIHGGMGYMQDTGVEKAVRDANVLRVIHGSPLQLALFVEAAAQWEEGV